MIGSGEQAIIYITRNGADKQYEVKEHKEKRSLSANSYFHVLCGKIGEAMRPRLSHTEVHNIMIADYGQIDISAGEIIMRDEIDWRKLDGIHLRPTSSTRVLDNGRLYRAYLVMRGSHTYDTREMAALIDGVVQEARQLDIETAIPSERDRMLEMWGREYARRMERNKGA